jgi:glycosyltransferase involved in cell wall biosynthesis
VASRRLLVLAPFPPGGFPAHGGSVAIAALVRALARRHRFALAYLRADDEGEPDQSVRDCCEIVVEGRWHGTSTSTLRPLHRLPRLLSRVLTGDPFWVAGRWSSELVPRLRQLTRSWRAEIVQAEFSAMGAYLPAVTSVSHAPTVVTFHDVQAAAAAARAAEATGTEWCWWRAEASLWRRFERRLLRTADASVALTERDVEALAALAPGAPIARIPLGIPTPAPATDPGGAAPVLLFVGNFNHPPNVDAARFLIDAVLPRVRRSHPETTLVLAGDRPPAWLSARAGGTIRVPGFVADLGPLLDAATVVVAPLRHGGGMRVKVLEALAAGKAVVGTTRAFEGTGAIAGRFALVADEETSFATALIGLLDDPVTRRALGAAARAHVIDALSPERTAAAYDALYTRLLAAPTGAATVVNV